MSDIHDPPTQQEVHDPAILAQANELLAPAWHVELTDLAGAVAHLRQDGRPDQTLQGELRSPATAHLLPGVLSSRVPVKQRNARAQTLLEREVEPYAAWATLLGSPYPRGEIREAWRLLLQNQPHDSICGCGAALSNGGGSNAPCRGGALAASVNSRSSSGSTFWNDGCGGGGARVGYGPRRAALGRAALVRPIDEVWR